jgi:small nuclear ribonucleoprotein (snRNP)-like protein
MTSVVKKHVKKAEPAEVQPPFIDQEVRVALSDGRTMTGTIVAYLGSGDLILANVVETLPLKAEKKSDQDINRLISQMTVPFRHIKGMQKRTVAAKTVYRTLLDELHRE